MSSTQRARVSCRRKCSAPNCVPLTVPCCVTGYISHLDFRKALYIHCGLPYSAVGVLMGASAPLSLRSDSCPTALRRKAPHRPDVPLVAGDVPSAGGMVDYTKWVTQFVSK